LNCFKTTIWKKQAKWMKVKIEVDRFFVYSMPVRKKKDNHKDVADTFRQCVD
jgi:hypothetical protein